jgi:hypothetical protein
MHFIWNEEKIRNLGNDFLRQVIANMERYAESNSEVEVRFGIKGDGIRPNYEIVVKSRFAYLTIGKEHKLDDKVEQFNDANLAKEKFSLAKIKEFANT